MADEYEMLEELGSKWLADCVGDPVELDPLTCATGGSFGVVYKAVEKATGELVAIKHVSSTWPLTHTSRSALTLYTDRP